MLYLKKDYVRLLVDNVRLWDEKCKLYEWIMKDIWKDNVRYMKGKCII